MTDGCTPDSPTPRRAGRQRPDWRLLLIPILILSMLTLLARPMMDRVHNGLLLRMPARQQWQDNHGYCGEAAVQQCALHYGAYISQKLCRAIFDPTQQQDLCIDESGMNLRLVFNALHLTYELWRSDLAPSPQYADYLVWIKQHLARRHPVIFTVFMVGENDPNYDHIMTAVGFTSRDLQQFHTDDALIFNDGFAPRASHASFGTLHDSRAMQRDDTDIPYAVPEDIDYGAAVTGIDDATHAALPVHLTLNRWDEPNLLQGDSPAPLIATVTVSGLRTGRHYVLYRYENAREVPSSHYATSPADQRIPFIAAGPSRVFTDCFMSDSKVIYRCLPAGV